MKTEAGDTDFPVATSSSLTHGRTVRSTSEPLQRQHDMVLEFAECQSTHHSTPIKVAVIV
jgi:hypothetical protein